MAEIAEGATSSLTTCFNSLISGKRPRSPRDHNSLPSIRISNTPPVSSGMSVTEPSSSAKVERSS
jgi:hypothetical protein